jgi:HPt (histidine-containing phosphotransfer) domain-containing protein
MNIGGGKTVTYHQWVRNHMEPEARAELADALLKADASYSGPVSLEKFKKDFCELSNEDRKDFIKMIQDSTKFVQSAMNESEFDAALQADLDHRSKEAYGAAWAKSVADAKARAEQAKREVFNDN